MGARRGQPTKPMPLIPFPSAAGNAHWGKKKRNSVGCDLVRILFESPIMMIAAKTSV